MRGIAVALAAGLFLVALWALAVYNRLVRLRQHLRESWADIDVELKRRHDLIPNLVAVVRGYAAHERDVLERVAELRNRAVAAHPTAASLAADESALMLAVKHLFAVVEAYPALEADGQFLTLQRALAETEDRIAAARRFYNANVRDLNTLGEAFPTTIVARLLAVEPASYFELDSAAERVVPRVAVA